MSEDRPHLLKLPPPPSSVANAEVVAALEDWLLRAKAGKIRGFIIVVDMGESTGSGIVRGDGSRHSLLSALEIVKVRFIAGLIEDSVDLPDEAKPGEAAAPEEEGPSA